MVLSCLIVYDSHVGKYARQHYLICSSMFLKVDHVSYMFVLFFIFVYISCFFQLRIHRFLAEVCLRGLRDNLELSPEFEDVEMSDLEQRRRTSLQVHLSKRCAEWFVRNDDFEDFGRTEIQIEHFGIKRLEVAFGDLCR